MTYCLFNRRHIALIAFLIIVFASPYLFQLASFIHTYISWQIFNSRADGEVMLAASPLRVPVQDDKDDYCRQFVDQVGKPIDNISYIDNGMYCGSFNAASKKHTPLLYKILSHGKAEYWIDADNRIIGQAPKAIKELSPEEIDNSIKEMGDY